MPTVSAKRTATKTFRIHFIIDGTTYTVKPLYAHPHVGSHAFRFRKQGGDKAVYDVHRTLGGHIECECLGHNRAKAGCKHVRTLQAAGMLPKRPAVFTEADCERPIK